MESSSVWPADRPLSETRLPPGQIQTQRFPVVGERQPSPDIAEWCLTIGGLVTSPRRVTWDDYLGLDHRRLTFDIHCVTSWSRLDSVFTGVPLASLIEPLPGGRVVSFSSYSTRDHHTSLPVDVALERSWVVHEFDDQPLSTEHGGPVRLVTPGRYFYKSVKWLKGIMVLATDRLGWWEQSSSYHNNADPTSGDERFTTGSVRPDQLDRFRCAPSYDKYRGRVMIGLDLTGWSPSTLDLRRLHLKNCDLSGVDLPGADLSGSNLSLSNLSGSNLRDADLSGSDLEGANFTGADLSGANLGHCALSATRFDDAVVAGASFSGVWGLVEDQQAYLLAQGIDLDQGAAGQ